MGFRRTVALVALLVPAVAGAQFPSDQGRGRMRDRYQKPQASAKLDEVVRKVNDPDADVRLEGVQELAQLEGDDAKIPELLQRTATDTDQRVRVKAIQTMGNLRVKDSTPFLVQQLFLRDTDEVTRRHILAALGKIRDRRTTQQLLDFVARNVDPGLRGNAIFALGEIGDPVAIKPLETLVASGRAPMLDGVAREAVRKIKNQPPPEVVPPALAGERREREGRPTP
ncbi:MAG: HEAT repeat domain-containing protein [Candidatus Binatia bacterium]